MSEKTSVAFEMERLDENNEVIKVDDLVISVETNREDSDVHVQFGGTNVIFGALQFEMLRCLFNVVSDYTDI